MFDKTREYYYKAKSGPLSARGKDGLESEAGPDPAPTSLYEIQDQGRRDPNYDVIECDDLRDGQSYCYGLEGLDGWYYRLDTSNYWSRRERDSIQSRELT